MKNLALLLFFSFAVAFSARATHLLGGNMGYVHAGPDPFTPGNTLYNVVFDAYIDCNSPNWGAAFPEANILVGVLEGSLSATSLQFEDQFTMTILDSGSIEPTLPNNCTFGSQNCIYLVRYTAQISLAPSSVGYHLIYDRCCRPASILNVANAGDEALTFQAFIPSDGTNLITNSSPVFTDTLASYICVGDTIAVPNSAIDPDGDSLVYSFQDPYDGLTGPGGGVNPPAINDYSTAPWAPYPYPVPVITWDVGFSLTQMFGAAGYNQINSVTGSTFFSAAIAGIYVAAVEIAEYRNGVQIGLTRRNIQLLAVDCPANPPPNQNTSVPIPVAVNPTVFVLEEGQNVCFDLTYEDPNGDSLTLTSSGTVFDAGITSPPASIVTPKVDGSTIATEFCWATQCGQAASQPYIFNVNVTDNGCPPKEFIESYQILVVPFVGPTSINGQALVCGGTDSISYSAINIPGANYQWTITGGSIVEDNGKDILVNWASSTPTGQVSLTVTSQYGCVRGPIDLAIQIDSVDVDPGPSDTICLGDSVQIGGSPSVQPGTSVLWTPATGLSDPADPNPFAKPTSTTTYTLTGEDQTGCRTSRSVTVTVNEPLATGLGDEYFICPGDTLDLTLQNTASASWTPSTSVLNPSGQNYQFFPSNDEVYALEYTDTQGCTGLDTIDVIANGTIPTDAGPDSSLCLGDTIQIGGNPTSAVNVVYNWTGLNVIDPNVSNPRVHPDIPGLYIVETSSDTCTGRDTVELSIRPNPPIAASPDTIVCTGDTAQLNVLTVGEILWSNSSTLSNDTIVNPRAFPASTTTYTVEVTAPNNCSSQDTVVVAIQPIPIADAGDTLIYACKLVPTVLGGSPTGPPGATFQWTPINNLSDASAANPLFTSDTGAVYRLLVTDTIGCTNEDSTRTTVMVISPSADSAACEGEVVFTSSEGSNGLAPYTYTYTPLDGVLNPNDPNSGIELRTSQTYEILATDSNGCSDSTTVFFEVAPAVNAQFSQTSMAGCDGIVYETTNQSTGADSVSWIYNNVQLSTEDDVRFVQPYGQDGILVLIGTNDEGCNDTVEVILPAQGFAFGDLEDELPNVFSPNGDGINDYFELEFSSQLADCIDMRVYNRWGMLIYESSGVSHSWDGRTFTGQESGEGVYFYTLDIKGTVYKGSVNLIR